MTFSAFARRSISESELDSQVSISRFTQSELADSGEANKMKNSESERARLIEGRSA